MKSTALIPFVLLILLISSCARPSINSNNRVDVLVENRIGKPVYRHFEDQRITDIINGMLCYELSKDMAVQIALLNNPRVQEAFEEIGIAQADLIEAGLLSNPIFEGFIRYPDKSGLKNDIEFSVMQNFLDLFLIPLRMRVATVELQQAIVETSHKIIEISFEVEKTYYELVGAYKKRELIKMFIEIAEIENEISLAQRKIGNINQLEQQLRVSQYLDKTLELVDAEKEIIQLKEKLNTLMGSTGCMTWSVGQELPCMPECEPNLECLELAAFNERLDIQAARWNIERIVMSFPTAEWWTLTNFQAGISSEREPEGFRVTGPQISAVLPIFNFGQASRKRILGQFRQAQNKLAALEIEAYAQVRQARETMIVFRNQINLYAEQILPNQQLILDLTEELYNVMGAGVLELLDTKRNQLQAYLNYYIALKNYWLARLKLDQAVGGKLNLLNFANQEAYTPEMDQPCF